MQTSPRNAHLPNTWVKAFGIRAPHDIGYRIADTGPNSSGPCAACSIPRPTAISRPTSPARVGHEAGAVSHRPATRPVTPDTYCARVSPGEEDAMN